MEWRDGLEANSFVDRSLFGLDVRRNSLRAIFLDGTFAIAIFGTANWVQVVVLGVVSATTNTSS